MDIHSTIVRLANKKRSFVQNCVKTESSKRSIPLTNEAAAMLTRLEANRTSEWVFEDDYGDHLSYEALRYQTQCACKAANVEYRGEHVFRHTFCCFLLLAHSSECRKSHRMTFQTDDKVVSTYKRWGHFVMQQGERWQNVS